MRQRKSPSETCVVKSLGTQTQEADLSSHLGAMLYFSRESLRATENTANLSASKSSGKLVVRGAQPHVAGRETIGYIVTNSLGFVSDTILYMPDPRRKTPYPKSRTVRGCCRSLFVLNQGDAS